MVDGGDLEEELEKAIDGSPKELSRKATLRYTEDPPLRRMRSKTPCAWF